MLLPFAFVAVGPSNSLFGIHSAGQPSASHIKLMPDDSLLNLVDVDRFPLTSHSFVRECCEVMDCNGVLHLPHFLREGALSRLIDEADEVRSLSFRSTESHNAYLCDGDPSYPEDHPRNLKQKSSKSLAAYDQLPKSSDLKRLYRSPTMLKFVKQVLRLDALYVSDDPMNAAYINYYNSPGDALGWHFDNSEFFVNLLLQKSQDGGTFEYVVNSRSEKDPNYNTVAKILAGSFQTEQLEAEGGSLIIFRGNKSIHRVCPVTEGERITAILTYESKPGIQMNEYTREKFFGRTIEEMKGI